VLAVSPFPQVLVAVSLFPRVLVAVSRFPRVLVAVSLFPLVLVTVSLFLRVLVAVSLFRVVLEAWRPLCVQTAEGAADGCEFLSRIPFNDAKKRQEITAENKKLNKKKTENMVVNWKGWNLASKQLIK
jgi:hypothetical protein